jgi:hypothetical protein
VPRDPALAQRIRERFRDRPPRRPPDHRPGLRHLLTKTGLLLDWDALQGHGPARRAAEDALVAQVTHPAFRRLLERQVRLHREGRP